MPQWKFNPRNPDDVALKVMEHLAQGVEQAAAYAAGEAIRLVNYQRPSRTTATGRRVGIYARDESETRAGKPPMQVTGTLKKSITWKLVATYRTLSGLIGSNVRYARRLEFGFVGTDALGRVVHQPPHPYLRPAILNNKKRIMRIIAKSWKRTTEKG